LYESAHADPEWSYFGNTAQALLNPLLELVEHYEARREGVAVTWVLRKAPPGTGDLSVIAEVAGLQHLDSNGSGHHFADASGLSRLRIGHVTLVDSRGQTWIADSQVTDNRLRIHVPAAVLSDAQYPLAIDPIVTAEFGLDLPAYLGPVHQRNPAVAFNGVNYLVVWDGGVNAQSIYGARLSPAGDVLDPNGIPISTSPAATKQNAAVASVGNDFLVTWTDYRPGGGKADIYGQRVQGDGTLSGSVTKLCTSSSASGGSAIAANGSSYLVVWEDSQNSATTAWDLYGAVQSASGALVAGNISISQGASDQRAPRIASNGSDFLVVWEDRRNSASTGSDIYGRRVNGSGVPQGAEIPVSTASADQTLPNAAFNGTSFLVVWQEARNSGATGQDIYGRLVNSSFALSGSEIQITTAPNDQTFPAVAARGATYLVVFRYTRTGPNYDVYGRIVGSDGTPAAQGNFAIATTGQLNFAPAVSSDANNFLAVWADYGAVPRSGLAQISGRRITTGGTLLGSSPFLISTELDNSYKPAIACNGQNYLVVWQQQRPDTSGQNYYKIFGTRLGLDGTVLDPVALLIGSPTGRDQTEPAVAASGSQYLVVWTGVRPQMSGRTAIYGSRVGATGSIVDGVPLTISINFQVPIDDYQEHAAVAGDGFGNYFVAWTETITNQSTVSPPAIDGARVSFSGTVGNIVAISDGAFTQWYPSIAADTDGNWLVVWQDYRDAGGAHVYGSRIRNSGTVLDLNGLPINTAAYSSFPAIAFNGSSFMAVWQDYRNSGSIADIYGARINTSGTVIDAGGFPIAMSASQKAYPSIAASGGNYLVSWQEAHGNQDIYAARVLGNGTVLDSPPSPINTSPLDHFVPKIAASASTNFLIVSGETPAPPSRARIIVNTIRSTSLFSLEVANLNDSGPGSLRSLIAAAASGDTITFPPNLSGRLTLTSGELSIGKNLTILGPGAKNLTVSGNNASRVFHVTAGNVTLAGLTISGGHDDGGGIHNQSIVTMSNCIISANTSIIYGGGGIWNEGMMTINGCTVCSNSTGGAGTGGGIYNNTLGNLILNNSTIAMNSATFYGGGGIFAAGPLSMKSCTIASNTVTDPADKGGGIVIWPTLPMVQIQNSIIAGNKTSTATNPDVAGPFTSLKNNLVGVTNGSRGWDAADVLGSTAGPINPRLGPLRDNGGPTLTMAVLPGSPAIDAGKHLTGPGLSMVDQRGRPRPADNAEIPNAPGGNGSDIGAYERAPNLCSMAFPPCLGISSWQSQIIVSWPNPTGFVLQENTSLDGATWANATNPPIVFPDEILMIVSPSSRQKFYRLKSP
jgi:hypothetical protein